MTLTRAAAWIAGLALAAAGLVWVVFVGLVASGGLMVMYESTNVLTASTELPERPSVCTVTGADPFTASVAEACAVTVPGVGEVKTTVHWPLAFVFAPAAAQVPVAAV